jgi:hypothetical protein
LEPIPSRRHSYIATMVGLNFTEQKNGDNLPHAQWRPTRVPGKMYSQSCTTPTYSPCARRHPHFFFLREFYERSPSGLRSYDHTLPMQGSHLYTLPWGNHTLGALRNTGAQTLLEAGVPKHMIQLIGRWCSDEIFCYLTACSETPCNHRQKP